MEIEIHLKGFSRQGEKKQNQNMLVKDLLNGF